MAEGKEGSARSGGLQELRGQAVGKCEFLTGFVRERVIVDQELKSWKRKRCDGEGTGQEGQWPV